ncbi:methyl-accepting chemotaxis protein, partial [Campylobacter canadensis]
MKLKNKIPLLVGIPLILCFIVLGIVSYNTSKSNSLEDSNATQKVTLDTAMLYIDSFFKAKKEFIAEFASIMQKINLDSDNAIISTLENTYGLSGFKSGLFYVRSSDGKVFYKENKNKTTSIITDTDFRKTSWYIDTLKQGVSNIGDDVWYDERSKTIVATISAPVKENGQIVGVVAGNVLLDEMKKNVLSVKTTPTSAIFAYDRRGLFVMHENPKMQLQKNDVIQIVDSQYQALKKSGEKNNTGKIIPITYHFNNADKIAVCQHNEHLNWTICNTNEFKDFEEELNQILKQNIILFSISLIVILGILFTLVKYSLKPIELIQFGLREVFELVNHERSNASKIELNTSDEFGDMAKAINENIEKTIKAVELDRKAVDESVRVAHAVEQGDLTIRIDSHPANPQLIELKNVLNEMLEKLEENIGADIVRIDKIFEEYSVNDFRNHLENAYGKVEVATNLLGNQIRQMLKENLNKAQILQDKSKALKDSMNAINNSARA